METEMQTKGVQTLIFWGFILLPVYSLATLGDAVIFNLIEFWTNQHISLSYHDSKNGTDVALEAQPGSKNATLTVSRDGQVVEQRFFVKVSDTHYEVRNAQGQVLGNIVKSADGKFLLQDAQGVTIQSLPANAL